MTERNEQVERLEPVTRSDRCSEPQNHDPHFYQTFIVGGPPGPVPTEGFICPGRIKGHA